MTSKIEELFNDEETVKFIFDHFRNIGIVGLVMSAGYWTRFQNAEWQLLAEMNKVEGSLLMGIGAYLAMMNINNLYNRFKIRALPKRTKWLFIITYALLSGSLIGYGLSGAIQDNSAEHKVEVPIAVTTPQEVTTENSSSQNGK